MLQASEKWIASSGSVSLSVGQPAMRHCFDLNGTGTGHQPRVR